MSQASLSQEQKGRMVLPARGADLQHAAVRVLPARDLPGDGALPAAGGGLRANFSDLPARSDGAACSAGPRRCPFGGACHACPARIQAKAAVSRPGDQYEQEADAVAEQITRAPRMQLQRSAASRTAPPVPPIVHEVLRSPGQPLDPDTRAFMEPRFGRGFGEVRVHTDSRATQSARAVEALAYTVGRDVVFGPGHYAPHTPAGQHLLAHELTHVLHQRSTSKDPEDSLAVGRSADPLESEAERVARALPDQGPTSAVAAHPAAAGTLQRRSIWQEFLGLFRGDDIPEPELEAYLANLDRTGAIEDHTDSDNKARAIVKAWRRGGSRFALTAQRKQLLIQEMQSGFTGDDDEQAILELLERSYNYELSTMIGSAGVSPASLESDFHGEERDRLSAFFNRRFAGGEPAVLSGQIRPRGLPLPLSIDIGAAGTITDATQLLDPNLELPGGTAQWNVPCVLGILCTQDRGVISQLPGLTVKRFVQLDVRRWSFDGTAWSSEIAHPTGMNNSDAKLIGLKADHDCDDTAQTLVHEVRHQGQNPSILRYHREVDAYTYTEQWSIARGLPGSPQLRTVDPTSGQLVPNVAVISQRVERYYGGPEPTPGEAVVGHRDPATSIVRQPGGSTYERASQQDDVYIDDSTLQIIGEQVIAPGEWRCPPVP